MSTDKTGKIPTETTEKDNLANLKFWLNKWIIDDFNNAQRKARIKRDEQITKFYEGNLDEKNFPWPKCANVNLLITEYFVDGIAIRLKNFLIGQGDFKVDLQTTDKQSVESVELVEKFINAVMNNVVKILKLINKITQNTAKTRCIVRADWAVEKAEREIWEERQMTEEELAEAVQTIEPEELVLMAQAGQRPTKKELKIVPERQEKAVVSIVPNIDFAVPLDATSLEDASRTAQRMYLTLDYMKEKGFKNMDKAEVWLLEKKKEEFKSDTEKLALLANGSIKFGEEKLTVYETTTIFTIEGKKQKWLIYYSQGMNEVLQYKSYQEIYGNRPTQFSRFVIKENGTFDGRSIGDICYHAHETGNNILNSSLNQIALIIIGALFYGEDAFEPDENGVVNIKVGPGMPNKVKDVAQLYFRDFPGQPLLSFDAIDWLIHSLERTVGLSAPQFSQPTAEKKTLGEIKVVRDEGNLRHRAVFTSAGEAFTDLIKTVLVLYQKHMAPEQFQDLVNEEGSLIFEDALTRESIQGNFEPTVKGAIGMDTDFEQQERAATLLGGFANPEELALMGNTRYLAENAVEKMGGDPKRALLSEGEVFQKQVQLAAAALLEAQKQMAEQGGGGEEAAPTSVPSSPGLSPELSGLPGIG